MLVKDIKSVVKEINPIKEIKIKEINLKQNNTSPIYNIIFIHNHLESYPNHQENHQHHYYYYYQLYTLTKVLR